MPEDNVAPENMQNAPSGFEDGQEASADTSAFDQLAAALSDTQNTVSADQPLSEQALPEQPFSNPNAQAEPFSVAAEPMRAADTPATQAEVGAQYTQPTQVLDPNQQPNGQVSQGAVSPQQPYDPNQAAYTQPQYAQPTQAYDPNQQAYAQPPYGVQPEGQPPYAQASGSNPGTVPLVLGILAILGGTIFGFTVVGPIAGIVLGAIGISKGSKVLKTDPLNGRAKGGKVTGIIGLILSILALIIIVVFTVIFSVAVMRAAEDPESFVEQMEEIAAIDETGQLQSEIDNMKEQLGMDSSSATDSATAGSAAGSVATGPYQAQNEDEQAAIDAVDAIVDAVIKPSAEDRASLETQMAESFESSAGFSLDELGITPAEFVSWLLDDVSYVNQDCYILSSGDSGWVDLTVTSRDFNDFMTKFTNGIDDFAATDDYSNITNESEAYLRLGDIMRDAMAQTGMSEKAVMVDVVKNGDTWECDESSLNSAFSQMFGMY